MPFADFSHPDAFGCTIIAELEERRVAIINKVASLERERRNEIIENIHFFINEYKLTKRISTVRRRQAPTTLSAVMETNLSWSRNLEQEISSLGCTRHRATGKTAIQWSGNAKQPKHFLISAFLLKSPKLRRSSCWKT